MRPLSKWEILAAGNEGLQRLARLLPVLRQSSDFEPIAEAIEGLIKDRLGDKDPLRDVPAKESNRRFIAALGINEKAGRPEVDMFRQRELAIAVAMEMEKGVTVEKALAKIAEQVSMSESAVRKHWQKAGGASICQELAAARKLEARIRQQLAEARKLEPK